MPANLENSAVAIGLEKVIFHPIPMQGNAKECSNCHIVARISHASKVMLKILQDSLQQYVNHELPDVQAGFRKGRGTRDQTSNIRWIFKKAREFQKNISVQFSHSVKSDSLRPHELQHTRPPCPSPTPRGYTSSCPLSW